MRFTIDDLTYLESVFGRFYDVGAEVSGGVSRLGYSPAEDEMHGMFRQLGTELGAEPYTDEAGNSFLKISPEEPYVLIGSHLDSVLEGGRYDGVAGILTGLLILRWAKLENRNIPVRVAAFRCEESSGFGVSTIGSGLVTGKKDGRKIEGFSGSGGETLGEVFSRKGYSITPGIIQGVKEYMELHIEQGRVLEENKDEIGIVSVIAGPRRFSLYIEGLAEHSGATPMPLRRDALCGAAELILEIEKAGLEESDKNSVSTVGIIHSRPNVLNVIPGRVQLQVDIRGIEKESLDYMEEKIKKSAKDICRRRSLTYYKEPINASEPVSLDGDVLDKLGRYARAEGIRYRRMISGAGHDAMNFVDIARSSLVFVPCKNGISHNKNEFAELEDICRGAYLFYRYICGEYAAE